MRHVTESLCASLSPEDQQAQSMPDASPAKWHRAHTTWFFETFVLRDHCAGYTPDPDYAVLFNSYYNGIGEQYPRPKRGLVTRPGAAEIGAYRERVDEAMHALLDDDASDAILALVALGLHHEQQHQELLLTDLKHLFSMNPLHPRYEVTGLTTPNHDTSVQPSAPIKLLEIAGGETETGHRGTGFAFDNEGPAHRVLLEPYAIADRLVTNAEYLAFIDDDGYRRPELWLSAGWDFLQSEQIDAPLYWTQGDTPRTQYTLRGLEVVEPTLPVVHVSYYEADAYARWARARLPTEHEWEAACVASGGSVGSVGSVGSDGSPFGPPAGLHPTACAERVPLAQCFGAAWQWTRSSYDAYPRYRAPAGVVGEYNGKFMSGQYVLRGSSCATPRGHARATYRNFFPPDSRWQFSGIRLAEDRP